MADQTEQEQMDPWAVLELNGKGWPRQWSDHVQPAALVYPADKVDALRYRVQQAIDARLRERDAQIARLSAQVEQERQRRDALLGGEACEAYRNVQTPCKSCGGWGVVTYSSTATWRGGIGGQAMTPGVCDRCWGSGDEHRKWASWRELDTLRAERDAAQQAHSELASLVGAALVYATLDSAAGERPATAPDHALTETVWKLVQQRGRMESALVAVRECLIALTPGQRTGYDWNADPLYLTLKEGEALNAIAAALQSTRPQEQPPEPSEPSKPSEPRKPVVNLMEALKKSLEAATHQQGGHQP